MNSETTGSGLIAHRGFPKSTKKWQLNGMPMGWTDTETLKAISRHALNEVAVIFVTIGIGYLIKYLEPDFIPYVTFVEEFCLLSLLVFFVVQLFRELFISLSSKRSGGTQ